MKTAPMFWLHETSGRGTAGFAVRRPTKGRNETRSIRKNLEERASRLANGFDREDISEVDMHILHNVICVVFRHSASGVVLLLEFRNARLIMITC